MLLPDRKFTCEGVIMLTYAKIIMAVFHVTVEVSGWKGNHL